MKYNIIVGFRILTQRQNLGLSRQQLADMVDLPLASIVNIEHGRGIGRFLMDTKKFEAALQLSEYEITCPNEQDEIELLRYHRDRYPSDFYMAQMGFKSHKGGAKRRGIGFELTFKQWWKIWRESGHWNERGLGAKSYCMARFGDKGPYAIGNVKIITVSDNSYEANSNRRKQ
jgi:hypothetical protein